MFTGIVQTSLPLKSLTKLPGLAQLVFQFSDDLLQDLSIGASVAVDGVCLTVTFIEGGDVGFDVMQQTLDVTTLCDLKEGGFHNIERSAKQGAEIGGHIVSGHIDTTAKIVAIEPSENNHIVSYQITPELTKYVFEKGFVALNGCSLTIAECNKESAIIKVCYIPETLRVTTHGKKQVGDRVNLEIERQTQTIVDTVERVLAERES